jgi:phosphatidate cytidylyltransferase
MVKQSSYNNLLTRTITAGILGILFWIIVYIFPPSIFSITITALIASILLFELPLLCPSIPYYLSIMLLYILPSWICLLLINHYYHHLIVPLFFITACFDTGAYCSGSYVGTHTIAPTISPHKTWEGIVGGFITAIIGALGMTVLRGKPLSLLLLVSAVSLICMSAFAGDLFESYLKRRAGIKDTGTLLPGHGGIFDRLDSVLPVSLLFYALHTYFSYIW